jgi:hypothetical protein
LEKIYNFSSPEQRKNPSFPSRAPSCSCFSVKLIGRISFQKAINISFRNINAALFVLLLGTAYENSINLSCLFWLGAFSTPKRRCNSLELGWGRKSSEHLMILNYYNRKRRGELTERKMRTDEGKLQLAN